MALQTWCQTEAAAAADATAIANTTTETSIYETTVPANFFLYVGRILSFVAYGKISTTGTPNITFVLRWGGAVSGVLLATSEAIANGSGVSNVNWGVKGFVVARSIGTAGTFLAFMDVKLHTSSTAVSHNVASVSGFDAPAVSASADTTTAKVLALCATWGTANAANTLTGMFFQVKSEN